MEISNEVRDKIYGAHIGCEVKCKKLSGWTLSRHTTTLSLHFLANYSDRIDKLLLTPLSAISDEHAVEVAKLVNENAINREHCAIPFQVVREDNRTDVWFGFDCVHIYHNGSILDNKTTGWVNMDVSDFLRSKSYHVPYMGIDLFETNIALDVTKINEDGKG